MTLSSLLLQRMSRHRFRNLFTVAGVALAVITFVLLRSVLSAWNAGADYAAQDRIATRHKASFVTWIPQRYVGEIATTPGVVATTWLTWFGGHLPDAQDSFFANWACDPRTLFSVYDELVLPEQEKQRFKDNRRGAIVGRALAARHGWSVGDKVVLAGTLIPGNWEFVIEGVYSAARRSSGEQSLFFHWNYLNESLPALVKEHVGYILSRVASDADAAQVAERIDQNFEPADTQTLTMSERALRTSFLGMLTTLLDVIAVVAALVVLIMVLLLGNTVSMAARESTREYATLRAVGFLPGQVRMLVVSESLVLGIFGGVSGVAASALIIGHGVGPFVEQNFTEWLPVFRLQWSDACLALATAAVGALLAAIPAAARVAGLVVTDALRKVG
jgi:putative ABC transport system permease protein